MNKYEKPEIDEMIREDSSAQPELPKVCHDCGNTIERGDSYVIIHGSYRCRDCIENYSTKKWLNILGENIRIN